MSVIDILFRDETKRHFKETTRPGGSYSTTIKYDGSFVIITDAYGRQNIFPESTIKEIVVENRGY